MTTILTPRTDKAAFREKVVRGEPVTAQEVFDVAVEGVILQGGASMIGKSCAYRAKNGRQCAAGQLIPDKFYCELMEGNNFGGTNCAHSKALSDHLELIALLQGAHDTSAFMARRDDTRFLGLFKTAVKRISWQFNLNVPPLAQIGV